MSESIGITSTIPIEIVLAAGLRPVDLNNVFITSDIPLRHIEVAESAGFPRSMCAWIKGIYGVAKELNIRKVVGVTEGDCSNTHSLLEIWKSEGIEVVNFSFPLVRSQYEMRRRLKDFLDAFGVTIDDLARVISLVNHARTIAHRIDEMTWKENIVSGYENHVWLVNTSDFCGDPSSYIREAEEFISRVQARPSVDTVPHSVGQRQFERNNEGKVTCQEARNLNPRREIRLGFVGVPPIVTDIYQFVEQQGARIVFNEIQRQFAMPLGLSPLKNPSVLNPYEEMPASKREPDDILSGLAQQYLHYTFPYGALPRIADIQAQIALRDIHGLIHYVQSFCFRSLHDILLRTHLKIPILTLEFDRPGKLDAGARTRIQAFLEILRGI